MLGRLCEYLRIRVSRRKLEKLRNQENKLLIQIRKLEIKGFKSAKLRNSLVLQQFSIWELIEITTERYYQSLSNQQYLEEEVDDMVLFIHSQNESFLKNPLRSYEEQIVMREMMEKLKRYADNFRRSTEELERLMGIVFCEGVQNTSQTSSESIQDNSPEFASPGALRKRVTVVWNFQLIIYTIIRTYSRELRALELREEVGKLEEEYQRCLEKFEEGFKEERET